MSFRKIKAGTTSVQLPILLQSSTTGLGLPGVAWNSAGIAAKYIREGDNSWTTITLASMTVGTYTSGGLVVDGSTRDGKMHFCPPDAALAVGAKWVNVIS